jgi:hypothetical protein
MKAPAEHASSRRASGVSVDMVVPVRLRPIGAAFVLVGVVDGAEVVNDDEGRSRPRPLLYFGG